MRRWFARASLDVLEDISRRSVLGLRRSSSVGLSVLLLLCGRGWWRGLLEIAAFIASYFWFSWLAFAVMVH